MKLVNPLYYPLSVLAGVVVMVVGTRVLSGSKLVVIPVALGVMGLGATVQKSQEWANPALVKPLQVAKQHALFVAEKAALIRQEAATRLSGLDQIDVLAGIQASCERFKELPQRVDQFSRHLRETTALLPLEHLQEQLQEVKERQRHALGSTQEHLGRMAESLERAVAQVQQGEDSGQAQVANLTVALLDATAILQTLQNALRVNTPEALETLGSVQQEMLALQETIDLVLTHRPV